MSGLNQQEIIRMMEEFDDQVWAKNSRFYKSVMQDGNIFNPYIHRRWLPAQFNRLIHIASHQSNKLSGFNLIVYFNSNWRVNSLIQNTVKEIHLLSFLEYRDRIAFGERNLIYSLEICKAILADYGEWICDIVGRLPNNTVVARKRGMWYRALQVFNFCKNVIEDIATKNSYRELSEFLNNCKLIELKFEEVYYHICSQIYVNNPMKSGKFDKAMNAYILAGAYYSLKSYYMFDKLERSTVKCQIIRNELEDGKDWKYFLREYCTVKGFDTNL